MYYDGKSCRIDINRREIKDNFTKPDEASAMRQYVINIYLTLMTREILGTYVYAVDPALRKYLKNYLN